MTVQDNPFAEDPIFIATEDHDFMLLFYSKVTILGVTTRTSTYKELRTCPHVNSLSAHEWDPHNVCRNLKSKYWFQTHKFGIKIPKSVQEAKVFDEENGNTLW